MAKIQWNSKLGRAIRGAENADLLATGPGSHGEAALAHDGAARLAREADMPELAAVHAAKAVWHREQRDEGYKAQLNRIADAGVQSYGGKARHARSVQTMSPYSYRDVGGTYGRAAYVRSDGSFTGDRNDVSPSQKRWEHGQCDSERCGYCYLNASHTQDEHKRKVATYGAARSGGKRRHAKATRPHRARTGTTPKRKPSSRLAQLVANINRLTK